DGTAEDDAFLGVVGGPAQGGAADADGGVGGDDPLGVEPGQDGLEALSDFADDVFVGNEQVVDEQLVGVDRVAAHLGDGAHGDPFAVHGREEQGEPVGLLGHLV